MIRSANALISACLALLAAATAFAQTPLNYAFTYQGRLENGGSPATGPHDLLFRLMDAPSSGNQLATTTVDDYFVTDGLLTTAINFGSGPFAGEARWLEVAVRPGASSGAYTTLLPRQALTVVPYAMYSLDGGNWTRAGAAITNANSGFVGINRSAQVTNSEYFGIQAPAADNQYGGMYIRTDSAQARPFYGYRCGPGGSTAWTYLDGATGDWRVVNGSDALTVTNAGNVGIGLTSVPNGIDCKLEIRADDGCAFSARNSSQVQSTAYFQNAHPSGYAGHFGGNVFVGGNVYKSGGTFRIDHPLDPANKYLLHSFVESPDRKNLYDGVVVTDGRGYATIDLPAWFEPLNRDFRYQLTVIDDADGDEFVQAKVVRKIADRKFTIRTSQGRVSVSWQVTGTRQDPWAEANPIQVEQEKPPHERGKYQHPELYGQPREAGIGLVSRGPR